MVLAVLESCKKVVTNSQDVKINHSKIPILANKICEKILKEIIVPEEFKKSPLHPKCEDESAVNWIFVIDSLNFCFFDPNNKHHWTVTWKNEIYTGYFGLCAAINKAIEKGIDLTDMKICKNLTKEQLDEILLGDDGTTLPLLEERFLCLQQAAEVLLKKYNGDFKNCIEEANQSAQKLLELISNNFSYFRDESIYNNEKVYIYKRAQILIADIWSSFGGTSLGTFYDIDSITMFADYRVPQVLLYYEVLEYSQKLKDILINGTLLLHGSPEEVEIRAASIVAVDLIVSEIKELLVKNNSAKICNSIMVDTYLWGYRRENASMLENIPYHKTLNIFY